MTLIGSDLLGPDEVPEWPHADMMPGYPSMKHVGPWLMTATTMNGWLATAPPDTWRATRYLSAHVVLATVVVVVLCSTVVLDPVEILVVVLGVAVLAAAHPAATRLVASANAAARSRRILGSTSATLRTP